MKNIRIIPFLLLIGITIAAGAVNLPQISTRVIQLAHINDIRTALSGDFVPRNSVGTATDVGANVGSTTYRWSSLISQNLKLIQDSGGNAVTLASPSSLASAYTITSLPSLPSASSYLTIGSTGQLGTFNRSGTGTTVGVGGTAVATFLSANTTSVGTPVPISGASVTITTTGRPIVIILTANELQASVNSGSPTQIGSSVYINDGTSNIAEQHLQVYSAVTTNVPLSLTFLDTAKSAGIYTYTAKMAADLSLSKAAIGPGSLFAYEL